MKETYRTKISIALIIPASIFIAGLLILMLVQGAWVGVIITVIGLSIAVHFVATSCCIIDGDKLHVKAGFFVNEIIDIHNITKIVPNDSLLSAPALPLNRLEIFYNRYDSLVVSPGNNEGFIAKLKAINPAIASF